MLFLEVEVLKNMIEGTETRDHTFDLIYSVVKFSNGRQLFFLVKQFDQNIYWLCQVLNKISGLYKISIIYGNSENTNENH